MWRQDLPPADSLDAFGRVVCPGPDAKGRKGRQGRGRKVGHGFFGKEMTELGWFDVILMDVP